MYQLHYLPSNATHHLMWCTEIGQKYQLLLVDLGFAAELWFLPGDNDRPPASFQTSRTRRSASVHLQNQVPKRSVRK